MSNPETTTSTVGGIRGTCHFFWVWCGGEWHLRDFDNPFFRDDALDHWSAVAIPRPTVKP